MAFVFGGILIVTGALFVGLAYHNTILQAWVVAIS